MPQGKKLLILNVLEILKKYSDAEHRLSVTDIVGILKKEYDMIVDRKAVKRNLDELRDMGYRINCTDSVRKKKDGTEEILQTDWYLSADFSEAELRIIIDIILFIGCASFSVSTTTYHRREKKSRPFLKQFQLFSRSVFFDYSTSIFAC